MRGEGLGGSGLNRNQQSFLAAVAPDEGTSRYLPIQTQSGAGGPGREKVSSTGAWRCIIHPPPSSQDWLLS